MNRSGLDVGGHVTSDRLGDAAGHGDLSFLRDAEQRHVKSCERCLALYGGYRGLPGDDSR